MAYLIVVAHPDDEVLGAGGTIAKLSDEGKQITTCILSGAVKARNMRPSDSELKNDIIMAAKELGVNKVIIGEFPNIAFNTVAHLELVQYIEKAIVESGADHIITHHPNDLNNDHFCTSIACQAAARLFQRKRPGEILPLQELLFMEVPSATDWSLNHIGKFNPNVFVEIGEKNFDRKLKALSCYRGVMRDYPHPRSSETLRSLAIIRGSQAGEVYAEAFECVFRRGIS